MSYQYYASIDNACDAAAILNRTREHAVFVLKKDRTSSAVEIKCLITRVSHIRALPSVPKRSNSGVASVE